MKAVAFHSIHSNRTVSTLSNQLVFLAVDDTQNREQDKDQDNEEVDDQAHGPDAMDERMVPQRRAPIRRTNQRPTNGWFSFLSLVGRKEKDGERERERERESAVHSESLKHLKASSEMIPCHLNP